MPPTPASLSRNSSEEATLPSMDTFVNSFPHLFRVDVYINDSSGQTGSGKVPEASVIVFFFLDSAYRLCDHVHVAWSPHSSAPSAVMWGIATVSTQIVGEGWMDRHA